jgi:hypothetical protein
MFGITKKQIISDVQNNFPTERGKCKDSGQQKLNPVSGGNLAFSASNWAIVLNV